MNGGSIPFWGQTSTKLKEKCLLDLLFGVGNPRKKGARNDLWFETLIDLKKRLVIKCSSINLGKLVRLFQRVVQNRIAIQFFDRNLASINLKI
jgi:hypothetical protein